MQTYLIPLIAFIISGVAQAADYSIETIEIKANKEKKSYKQSTESIAVIKKEEIASPLQDNSLDSINALANVTVNKEEETFTIRGVKNVGVTGYQKDNLASIIIDNIFQTDLAIKAGSFNLWDLSSLEIYRGAQSTTQGINSLAGSFNIFHNSPKNIQENALRAEYGNHGRMGINAMTNFSLIDDKMFVRLTGSALSSDGYIANKTTNNNDWAKKEQYNVNLDISYKINNQEEIRFVNKYFKSLSGGSYVHGPNPFKYEVFEDLNSSIKTTNAQSGLEYNKILNENFSNHSLFSYSNSKQSTSTDSDLTSLNRTGVRKDYHRDNFLSFENLLKYKSESLKNVFGIHYHQFSLVDNYDFNVLPISNNPVNLNIKQYVDRKRKTYSLFDSLFYEFNEQHAINVGARYEFVKNNYLTNVSGARIGSSGNAATNTYLDNYVRDRSGAYGGSKGSGKILPKAGYLYSLGDHTFGVSFVEGYRTGGVSINRYRTTAVNYDPESTYTYELSYKSNLQNMNISSNAFYTNWRRQQVQISLSSDTYDTQVTNASRSEYFGGELQLNYKLSALQDFKFSTGFVQSRFVNFISGNKNYTGKEFPNSPNWTVMMNHGINVFNDWQLKTTLRYLGTSFADAENTKAISEQFYTDIGLQFFYKSLVPEITIRNIFNNKYITNTFTNSYGTYHQMSTPREIVGSLSFLW